jgi:mRNA interferase HicA
VKRRDLVRHLEVHGCVVLREGANHINRPEGGVTTVSRHREINEFLARKICRDLGIVHFG